MSAFRTIRSRTPRCQRARRQSCPRLLRTHIGGGAEDHAFARAAGYRRRLRLPPSPVPTFAKAEVEHLHGAVGRDLDVGGLEIPMDDALLVGGVERVGDLTGDGQRLVQ